MRRTEPLTLDLSPRERRLVEELRVLAALATDADLVRLALHNLADHYDLPLAAGEFEYVAGIKITTSRLRRRRHVQATGIARFIDEQAAVGCMHGTRITSGPRASVGRRCRRCEKEIARTLADYRLDQLEGKHDAAGFTPAERKAKGRR
jgi:hypothetical protein